MKRTGKVFLYGAVVLALVLIGLVVLVKLMLTPERVRSTVLPLAQKALQREVRLGDINVSLFSGVTVRDVAVLEVDNQETFAAVDAMVLRYQFWPLLRRQVVIDEIRLEGPHLRIVRQVDGRFNFSDLLEKKEGAAPPPTPDPVTEGKGLDLRIARFTISDGDILFIDQVINPATPLQLTADKLEVTATNLSLDRPFPFELGLHFSGAPLSMAGSLDLATKGGTVTIRLQGLDATAFAPYYQKSLPGKLAALKINSDLNVAATPATVKMSGRIEFADTTLTLDALPQAPLKQVAITLECDLSVDLDKEVVTLGRNRLSMGGALLDFGGSVSNYIKDPAINVTLDFTADKILLDPILAASGKTEAQVEPAAAVVPSVEPGPLDLPVTAKGSGKVGALVYHGLTISDLDVRFTLEKNILTVSNFSGRVAQGTFSGTKRVDLGRKGFAYDATLKVRQVDANPLTSALYPPIAGTIGGLLDVDLDLNGAGTTTASLQRNLSGAGKLTITDAQLSGSGLAKGLASYFQEDDLRLLKFSQFSAGFRISNGQILVDGDFSGSQVKLQPQGTVGLDGSLDLRLPMRVPPELGRKLGVKINFTGVLRDSEGWTVLPLTVKGSMSEPVVGFDSKAARAAAGANLQDRLERSLDKRLRKSSGDAAGEEGKKNREELKDTLKGLLGR